MSKVSKGQTKWDQGKRQKTKKKSKDAPGANLVPCTGTGSLRDYGEYLKAGGYVPVPVLDAEEGVKVGIFAEKRPTKDELMEEAEDIFGMMPKGGNAIATLDFAELSIQRQYDKILDQYGGKPEDDLMTQEEEQAIRAIKSLGFVKKESDPTDVFGAEAMGKKEEEADSPTKKKKKPRRESLSKRTENKTKKNPARKSATDDLLLFEDDGPSSNNAASAADSGYSSARKSSTGGGGVSSGSTLPTILGESSSRGSVADDMESIMELEDIDPALQIYQNELKEHKLLQEAMAGQNLLGMMIEDKPKYGQQGIQEEEAVEGIDAIDLFLDPTSVFGSERHPALQEVLKQIEKQKEKRGEELQKLKKIAKDLKQQRGNVGRLLGMV